MAGTWTSQNKVLPGAYLNFLTKAALSITPGDRGTVVLLQEMTVGIQGEMYIITALDVSQYPALATAGDKLMVNEALKGAKTVIIYNLGITPHDAADITAALVILRTVEFDVLVYPYVTPANQLTIATWTKAMVNDEGVAIQTVMADYVADSEYVINVAHAVELADGTSLTKSQTTAWVGGVTAGAKANQSNTGRAYEGAVDVIPRMTKTEMEAAITAGKFIFKVDTAQNVTAVYDINSLTTFSVEKSKKFRKNRFIRTNNGINNDINEIFESNFKGKVDNSVDGRALQKASYVGYFIELQRLKEIENFVPDDVTVEAGTDSDATVVVCNIQQIDSTEKMYMTINLA